MNSTEIIRKYTNGEVSLAETNAALKLAGVPFHLDPQRNYISPAEKDLYGLLDTGTGSLDKVRVRDGRLNYSVNEVLPDGTVSMWAQVYMTGKVYTVYGDLLVLQE